jgi:integrase
VYVRLLLGRWQTGSEVVGFSKHSGRETASRPDPRREGHFEAGNAKPTTTRVFRWCIEANLKPYFGDIKAATLSTPKLKAYRDKRKADGVTETTCNRELSILRIALNLGRKSTPAKVVTMTFFPMVREDNARQGFLTDQQYAKLRDALPDFLKPLFVTAYHTGVRLGELLAWDWDHVDWNQAFITLKASETRAVTAALCQSWTAICGRGWSGR